VTMVRRIQLASWTSGKEKRKGGEKGGEGRGGVRLSAAPDNPTYWKGRGKKRRGEEKKRTKERNGGSREMAHSSIVNPTYPLTKGEGREKDEKEKGKS